ncbi:uncharacterized protein LOC127143106 [Lates calcarifer]|uniref:Uncharacterized protein LOC127143106 n=1 Tax=Lates calcarifer TaxID=8187 RepID=A0AAJ8BCI1_LATCA|nr:uncharacterized protein LOC127143106 [Lates calcarifer]
MNRKRYRVVVSEELNNTIEKCSKCFATCHMPLLATALDTRVAEMTEIKECYPNNIVVAAKAMMHCWAKHQSKPTPERLLTTLSNVNLPVPNQSATREMSRGDVEDSRFSTVSLYPRRPGPEERQTDEDFLSLSAVAQSQYAAQVGGLEASGLGLEEQGWTPEREESEQAWEDVPADASQVEKAFEASLQVGAVAERATTPLSPPHDETTGKDTNVQALKFTIEMDVCKHWTSSEFMDMLRKAPNPIRHPDDYLAFLTAILNSSAARHMTAACSSCYEAVILSSPQISLKRSPPLNPTTLLPLRHAEIKHDCIATIEASL